MEVAPFFVGFHNLRSFVAIYIMSRFTHFFRNFFLAKIAFSATSHVFCMYVWGICAALMSKSLFLGHPREEIPNMLSHNQCEAVIWRCSKGKLASRCYARNHMMDIYMCCVPHFRWVWSLTFYSDPPPHPGGPPALCKVSLQNILQGPAVFWDRPNQAGGMRGYTHIDQNHIALQCSLIEAFAS